MPNYTSLNLAEPAADPGFSVRRGAPTRWGRHRPPRQAHFGGNIVQKLKNWVLLVGGAPWIRHCKH